LLDARGNTGKETLLDRILGSRLHPDLADRLHDVSHHGRVELLRLEPRDVQRRRMRATTDAGNACMIALGRTDGLFDGAVLLLEPHRAIVVRVTEETWLRLRPSTLADALELGHAAGNLHWRVRFADAGELDVALEGPVEGYLARIAPLLESGRVTVLTGED
jgi:urease accessory protein